MQTYLLSVNQYIRVTTGHDIKKISTVSLSDNISASGDRERLHDVHHILDSLRLQVIEHIMFL